MTTTIVDAAAPAFSVHLNGADEPLQGWVVVDSLVDGLAMGGVRMTTTVDYEEVCGLARDMTDKFTLAGLRIGGAKGGIVSDGTDRQTTFRTFGRTVKPLLHGGIHLGIDLGVTPADRAVFFESAGYDPRYRLGAPDIPIDWRTYYEPLIDVTGYGVAIGALTALEAKGHKGPARVVIQGFGAVGRSVAQFLESKGHIVTGVADILGTVSANELSTAELIAATDAHGRIDRSQLSIETTQSTDLDAWLDVEADLLVLAAQKHALTAENVTRLRAGIVVEGANLASTTEGREAAAREGVLLVPGVIANIGGAGAAALAVTRVVPFDLPADARKQWVFDWVAERVRRNTRDLFDLSAVSPSTALDDLLTHRRKERQ
ncbi:Glu/Leu/Phe/Val dehydrogenase dimerization domain-containing protein [Rhodococcus sp. NPDC057135]|uniref:Glu/Leu/Phe/Val dehydrogenase dimerization domain-containing protein n=1 Tax=Rhodococcus sp. NPDC057135 TaxID=3346028 RepID=UPI003636C2D3